MCQLSVDERQKQTNWKGSVMNAGLVWTHSQPCWVMLTVNASFLSFLALLLSSLSPLKSCHSPPYSCSSVILSNISGMQRSGPASSHILAELQADEVQTHWLSPRSQWNSTRIFFFFHFQS